MTKLSERIIPPIEWKQTSERVWDAVIAEGWKARVVHALGDDTWSYVVNHSGRCCLPSKEDAMRQAEDNANDRIWSEIIAARRTIAAFPNAFESAPSAGCCTSFEDAAKWHEEEAKRLEGVETFNKRIRHKLAFHQICAAQFRAMKNSSPQEFPYDRTFNAIAAATRVEGGNVAISVRKFVQAFGGRVVADSTTAAVSSGSSDRHPEWIWYGEDDDGNSRISTGRWAIHPYQKRYKLAEIQPTEHDHKSRKTADALQRFNINTSFDGPGDAVRAVVKSKNGVYVRFDQANELLAGTIPRDEYDRKEKYWIEHAGQIKVRADRAEAEILRLKEEAQAWHELRQLTFAIQHNPNCPDMFLIRLPGRSGRIDLKPYADQMGFRKSETEDVIGFGKTLAEALAVAVNNQMEGGGNDE